MAAKVEDFSSSSTEEEVPVDEHGEAEAAKAEGTEETAEESTDENAASGEQANADPQFVNPLSPSTVLDESNVLPDIGPMKGILRRSRPHVPKAAPSKAQEKQTNVKKSPCAPPVKDAAPSQTLPQPEPQTVQAPLFSSLAQTLCAALSQKIDMTEVTKPEVGAPTVAPPLPVTKNDMPMQAQPGATLVKENEWKSSAAVGAAMGKGQLRSSTCRADGAPLSVDPQRSDDVLQVDGSLLAQPMSLSNAIAQAMKIRRASLTRIANTSSSTSSSSSGQ